ncbi:hypothetical protein [Tunturiibacter gelidiferens]|uniref:hypothetical protein n=1 Tax=Tunturiibacter gelidiferens TaxID=3069689 RepID=UPI003D9B0DEB
MRALGTAQEAVTALVTGMEGLKSEAAPSVAMSSAFTGTQEARNKLHCAAYLISRYKAVDKDDETVKSLLIVAYNQEAAVVSDLERHIKEQFLRSDSQSTQAAAVKDAERITAMNALQHEAALNIAEATTFSLMLSVDRSDPAAKNTAQTVLACDQYADLKKSSAALAGDTKSAYTNAASLFVSFLDGHKCR